MAIPYDSDGDTDRNASYPVADPGTAIGEGDPEGNDVLQAVDFRWPLMALA